LCLTYAENMMYSHLLEEISKAIGARLLLQFSYKGNTLVVEPYLVGKNKLNEDCLRAWQVSSIDGPVQNPTWQCYTFSGMSNLKILDKRFSNKRPGYDPYDNSMKHIYYRI